MLPQIVKLKGLALDFLFPRQCVGCGREGDFLCDCCRRSLTPVTPPLCPRCGRPQISGNLCPSCLRWQASINGIRSPFRFTGAVKQAVYELKYRNVRAISPALAGLLGDYFSANPLPGDILIPVPLHPKRLKERGYNQSNLLARDLSKIIGLPVIEDGLVRQRHTLPQARTATVSQRQRNITGAFICSGSNFSGKNIILVDDVATSGMTLDSCAAALKKAGAVSIWGLTLAREI